MHIFYDLYIFKLRKVQTLLYDWMQWREREDKFYWFSCWGKFVWFNVVKCRRNDIVIDYINADARLEISKECYSISEPPARLSFTRRKSGNSCRIDVFCWTVLTFISCVGQCLPSTTIPKRMRTTTTKRSVLLSNKHSVYSSTHQLIGLFVRICRLFIRRATNRDRDWEKRLKISFFSAL